MAISDTARHNHDELFPGYVSSLEVTQHLLARVAAHEHLGAFLHVDAESALATAA